MHYPCCNILLVEVELNFMSLSNVFNLSINKVVNPHHFLIKINHKKEVSLHQCHYIYIKKMHFPYHLLYFGHSSFGPYKFRVNAFLK